MHQSEDKAFWKAKVMGEMRDTLESIRRKHLEEIGDCHHRLLLAKPESNHLRAEVADRLTKKAHELDSNHASLKGQV